MPALEISEIWYKVKLQKAISPLEEEGWCAGFYQGKWNVDVYETEKKIQVKSDTPDALNLRTEHNVTSAILFRIPAGTVVRYTDIWKKEKVTKEFKCEICGLIFASQEELDSHKQLVHGLKPEPTWKKWLPKVLIIGGIGLLVFTFLGKGKKK